MRRTLRLFSGPLGAILLAFALAALAMIVANVSPIDGFWALFVGSLGGREQIAETLVQTTALLFPALGISIAFRAGLFNIGAEGQLVIGGLAAGALGAQLHAPGPIAIVILLAAGFVGGGLWGGIAGWLRARFNANEIISTLMLNFIALSLANYLVSGPAQKFASSRRGNGAAAGAVMAAGFDSRYAPLDCFAHSDCGSDRACAGCFHARSSGMICAQPETHRKPPVAAA